LIVVSSPFRAACIQLNAGNDLSANITEVAAQIGAAAADGAHFIALPENALFMPASAAEARAHAKPEDEHLAVAALSDTASAAGVWLLAGTVAVAVDDGRLANRSLVIGPDGSVTARYDKIHMFDVDLAGERAYRESETYRPGEAAVTVDLPWIRLGLSVCYDVRFPGLYRALAQSGASMLAVPSAFTAATGKAHWHTLLRARAIENACYVIAPAQCGVHPGGRQTFGHAMIVSPWGEILAEAGEIPGRIEAQINPAEVAEARRRIPVLDQERPFTTPG